MNSSASNSTTSATLALILNLQAVLRSFNLYGSIFIMIPGVILNSFTFFVFLRKRFWNRTTMGYYYAVHALFSALADAVGTLVYFPALFNFDLAVTSVWMCRIMWLIRSQIVQYSSYFGMLTTVDRTINVLYPRRFTFLAKIKNLFGISLALWVAIMLINMFQWWRYMTVSITGSRSCAISSVLSATMGFVGLVARLVPSTSSLIMNLVMMRTLFKSKSNMRKRDGQNGGISRKEYTFAVSLISMNFILIIITLPNVIINCMLIYNLFASVSTEYATLINVLYTFGSWGNYLNESLYFWLMLCFNKIFRDELFMMTKFTNRLTTTAQSLTGNNKSVSVNQKQ